MTDDTTSVIYIIRITPGALLSDTPVVMRCGNSEGLSHTNNFELVKI